MNFLLPYFEKLCWEFWNKNFKTYERKKLFLIILIGAKSKIFVLWKGNSSPRKSISTSGKSSPSQKRSILHWKGSRRCFLTLVWNVYSINFYKIIAEVSSYWFWDLNLLILGHNKIRFDNSQIYKIINFTKFW